MLFLLSEEEEMSEARMSRRWGRSVVAVLAGIFVGAVLSLGVDQVLHMTGVYPPWGERMSDGKFVLATAYRLVFSVIGCYVIARLAPDKPMQHALVGGAIGLLVSLAGAIATWNRDIGPHWYSLLLAITALPCAWVGGRLWQMRPQQRAAV
jgi:hypothetical protein